MARPESRFVCQSCGDAFLRWEGQCRSCGAWNSLVETVVRASSRKARSAAPREGSTGPGPTPLRSVVEPQVPRLSVGIGEFDRVLGGGLVPGSVVLVGGEPGTTIVVDRDPEAGLDIRAAETKTPTPVEVS